MNYNYRSMRSNTEPYFEYSVRCDDKIAIDFIKNIDSRRYRKFDKRVYINIFIIHGRNTHITFVI